LVAAFTFSFSHFVFFLLVCFPVMYRHVKACEGASFRPCVMRGGLLQVLPSLPASLSVKPCEPFRHHCRVKVFVGLLVDPNQPPLRGSKPTAIAGEPLKGLFSRLQGVAKGFAGFFPPVIA
jgi:hypothetical protein